VQILQVFPSDGKSSLRLIIHEGLPAPKAPANLPILSTDYIARQFRLLDDWPTFERLAGYDAATISMLGYRTTRRGVVGKKIEARRGSAIVPVRDPSGRVVALQDGEGNWLTRPRVHCVNMVRRFWTGEIEIFENVIQADVNALTRNISALVLGGLELRQLSQNLLGPKPAIVFALEVAA